VCHTVIAIAERTRHTPIIITRRRAIQYSETPVIESTSRAVPVPALARMTTLYGAGAVSHGGSRILLERLCLRTIFGFMAPRRTSQNYTIEPFRMGPDQNEIGLLYLNFRAENLASAQAQAMIYLRNDAFVKDIDGVKLLRNAAEVWRWSKAKAAP
jgi:hypothetical protein